MRKWGWWFVTTITKNWGVMFGFRLGSLSTLMHWWKAFEACLSPYCLYGNDVVTMRCSVQEWNLTILSYSVIECLLYLCIPLELHFDDEVYLIWNCPELVLLLVFPISIPILQSYSGSFRGINYKIFQWRFFPSYNQGLFFSQVFIRLIHHV